MTSGLSSMEVVVAPVNWGEEIFFVFFLNI